MSRVELVCLRSIRAELVRNLQERGLLHLDEVSLEVDGAPEYLNRIALEGDEFAELTAAEEAERALAEVAPLLTVQPADQNVSTAARELLALSQDELVSGIGDWASRLRETTRMRIGAQDQLEVLKNYRTVIEQVAPSLGSDVKLGSGTRALVLDGDVARVVTRIEERLENELGNDYTFYKNQSSKKHLVGLLSFPDGKSEMVSKILNQEGIAPMDMSDGGYVDLTAQEVLSKIGSTVDGLQSELVSLVEDAKAISEQVGANVLAARSIVRDAVARLRASGNFAQSEMVAVIQGWTPSDEFEGLKNVIESEFAGQVDVNAIDGGDPHHVSIPTQLRNNKFFKPFEAVMGIFKPPAYGTVDPTSMVAIAFILFYGFILGDVIYGLAVIALATFLGRKLGHIPIVKDVQKIGTYMGISGAIFGALYGEWCGSLGTTMFGLKPLWFDRHHETTQLLVYAIYVGIFHIVLGLILGVKEDFRHGHKKHAIEKLGMLFGLVALIIQAFAYFGVAPFTSGVFGTLSLVMGGVGVVFIFYAMGAMGLIGVIEIMSLGGNVLSYARLMALGVASIALAQIANQLPTDMGYVIGIPMAFAVHVLNIGIGIASPTIHSLRLNFVEFLPKFYAPEGKGFEPFKKETVS
jgi:V/A-type H+/Na+-transporting ATPase subunit I